MGPLVPDIVSQELSIVSALLIGIAFGYVLEQAGFSSPRRLAGLFYGYDFTVLRVFFTAAVTAMCGLFVLGWLGILDLSVIYIHPLHVAPALVGGAIMGVGFILGGYCPETSVCAAAIGKKDAWIFVLGGFLGMFLYGEIYPAVAGFINSGSGDPVQVHDSLGLPRGVFALLLVLGALGAFAVTTRIERRVNPDAPSLRFSTRKHRLAAAGAIVLAITLLAMPERRAHLLAQVADPAYRPARPLSAMSVDELALRLLDRDPDLTLIDLRAPEAFAEMRLPQAVNVSLEELPAKRWKPLLARRDKTRVFVDDNGTLARRGALLAQRLGYQNNRPLEGGIARLKRALLREDAADERSLHPDTRRFRAEAREPLEALIRRASAKKVKRKKVIKRVKGGC